MYSEWDTYLIIQPYKSTVHTLMFPLVRRENVETDPYFNCDRN